MNQTQAKYAMDRISSLEKKRIADLIKKHTKVAKKLTGDEKLKLVLSGAVKLRKGLTAWPTAYYNAEELFDFSKHMWTDTVDSDALAPEHNEVVRKAHAARDAVMLGDESEALRLIKEFAGE